VNRAYDPSKMASRRRQTARLGDGARDAGAHLSTVSRVLSGQRDAAIRLENEQRIFESAKRLRRLPHALGLRLSATTASAGSLPSLRNPDNSPIIPGRGVIQMPLLSLVAPAIDALVARIDGGAAHAVVVGEIPTLVDRASTARLR